MNRLAIYCVIYNRGDYIYKSVSSLLDNSPSNTTIVLVDDKSTDNTIDILNQFAIKDSRVVIIANPINLGFTTSLKNAIEVIENERKHDYIAIHGAGDIAMPGRFESQTFFLDSNEDYSFVGCRHQQIKEDSSNLPSSEKHGVVELSSLLENAPFWTHGTVMYRAVDYFESKGYDSQFKYCQDWALYTKLLLIGKGCVLNIDPYTKVVFRDGATFSPIKRVEQLKYAFLICNQLEPNDLSDSMSSLQFYLTKEILRSNLALIKKKEKLILSDWRSYLSSNNSDNLRYRSILLYLNKLFLKLV
ncbi:glycosyltransferase family 2 protein [Vibrio cyclitrophicus]|uniref:glycosyltransferase family 2 protein n=1 Tax=Vibrio cyclitrophicus TaxID=47951 RepID=UPI0011B7A48E|nr:glycosyltransferase family 2 protein [Vibrio cyclitrophicus]